MEVVVARAPTRIDFGGGWTDVPPYSTEQGGCVCNLAIARRSTVRLAPFPGRVAIDEQGRHYEAESLATLAREGAPALLTAALRRAAVSDVRLTIHNDFPFGAGLGGSSAAGVALSAAVALCSGQSLEPAALAERSRALEVEELGVAGGRQDHYAAAFGGALGLRFDEQVTVRRLPLSGPLGEEIERRCIVAYTGQSRISSQTVSAVIDAYRAREPRVGAALARLRDLAQSMIEAVERESLDELGALVAEHWVHQRALHPRITTPGIERVLAAATTAGAIGGKALGASGGGCVLVVAAEGRERSVRDAVATMAELLPYTIDRDGVRVNAEEAQR